MSQLKNLKSYNHMLNQYKSYAYLCIVITSSYMVIISQYIVIKSYKKNLQLHLTYLTSYNKTRVLRKVPQLRLFPQSKGSSYSTSNDSQRNISLVRFPAMVWGKLPCRECCGFRFCLWVLGFGIVTLVFVSGCRQGLQLASTSATL